VRVNVSMFEILLYSILQNKVPIMSPTILKNGVGAWECWNVSGKKKTEIGDVDKTY
jgi:hypothetical protein